MKQNNSSCESATKLGRGDILHLLAFEAQECVPMWVCVGVCVLCLCKKIPFLEIVLLISLAVLDTFFFFKIHYFNEVKSDLKTPFKS